MAGRSLSWSRSLVLTTLAALLVWAGMSVMSARASTPVTTYYACVAAKTGTPYNVQSTGVPTCAKADQAIQWSTTDLVAMQAQIVSLQTQVTALSGLGSVDTFIATR